MMLGAFLFGAAGYPLLELLYRRRTHYSMAIAGGCAAILLRGLGRMRLSPALRAVMGGIGITCIEYACGKLWNRRWQVWDYRRTPLNWRGQVCLPYALLWCVLSGLLSPLFGVRKS